MSAKKLKVVQLYSCRRDAAIVGEAIQNLRRDLPSSAWLATTWNTELLRSPKLCQMAAKEAGAADLILIAMDEGLPLSPEMEDWLKRWPSRNRRKRGTLVAFLRREDASANPVVQEALHAFAEATRLNFFCHSRVECAVPRFFDLTLEPFD